MYENGVKSNFDAAFFGNRGNVLNFALCADYCIIISGVVNAHSL